VNIMTGKRIETTALRFLLLSGVAFRPAIAQIGTMIPDGRLPLVGASPRVTVWQRAGFLSQIKGKAIKFTRMVDVAKDCGARGDGTTDNAEVVIRVLKEAQGKGFTIIYFPKGVYRISRGLSLPSNVLLKGDGSPETTLKFCAPGHCITVSGQKRVGIEDLKLIRCDAETRHKYFIRFTGAHSCWVRGVESCRAQSNHISLGGGSHHIEIRGCYIHDSICHAGGGNGYGVVLGRDVYECLIEDNVLARLRHCVVTGGKCHGNVYGYNAHFDNCTETAGPGVPAWCVGDIEVHGNSSAPAAGGAYENLFEGNYANFIWVDAYWGDNGPHNTFFRNTARKGGLIIEGHYSSSHGGAWTDCNNRQNVLNNALRDFNWLVRQRFGAPWGDGHVFSTRIGGKAQWSHNNRTETFSLLGLRKTAWESGGKEPQYLSDFSYYHSERPPFMADWPYDPYDLAGGNPAAKRYRSGGQVTVTAGFSGYR